MSQYKVCKACRYSKSLTEFSPDKRAKDGCQTQCKACKREFVKLARRADPEKNRAYNRAWHRANPDKAKAKKQKYYEKYGQKARDYVKKYRQENPDKVAAALSRWRRNNPETVQKYQLQRRALLKSAKTFDISAKEIWRLYNGSCIYCGEPSQTIEHIVPLSRNGSHGIGNLAPCCSRCNNSKNNKFITEWKKVRGW